MKNNRFIILVASFFLASTLFSCVAYAQSARRTGTALPPVDETGGVVDDSTPIGEIKSVIEALRALNKVVEEQNSKIAELQESLANDKGGPESEEIKKAVEELKKSTEEISKRTEDGVRYLTERNAAFSENLEKKTDELGNGIQTLQDSFASVVSSNIVISDDVKTAIQTSNEATILAIQSSNEATSAAVKANEDYLSEIRAELDNIPKIKKRSAFESFCYGAFFLASVISVVYILSRTVFFIVARIKNKALELEKARDERFNKRLEEAISIKNKKTTTKKNEA